MKSHYTALILVSFLLAIGLAFLVFNFQANGFGLTGFATQEQTTTQTLETESSETNEQTTEQEALEAIEKIKQIIEDTQTLEIPTIFMQDKLKEAQIELERAQAKQILDNPESSFFEEKEANKALRLVDLEDIGFHKVTEIAEEIEQRKEKAIVLSDSILASQLSISLSPGDSQENTETSKLSDQINEAFQEERFQEVEALLKDLRDQIELERQESATLSTLQKNTRNFVSRYRYFILGALLIVGLLGFISQRRISRHLLTKKVKKMKTEKTALTELLKKAQTERFKENKISDLIYKIKTKKYNERINEIKETLPVLESRLRKNKSRKTLKTS